MYSIKYSNLNIFIKSGHLGKHEAIGGQIMVSLRYKNIKSGDIHNRISSHPDFFLSKLVTVAAH